jgi:flagellum-specific ATP synthase
MSALFDQQLAMLDSSCLAEIRGTVVEVRGLAVRVADLPVPIGAMVELVSRRTGQRVDGEVVGFDQAQTIVMPLHATQGIGRGDHVVAAQFAPGVLVGDSLLGRVIDGMGRPIDGLGPLRDVAVRPLHPPPLDPLDRPLISEPLATGVRAIDGLAAIGRGQRIGVFASPGVGKSTLLAMMARNTAADVSVIALVGERGREVRDFIDNQLGEQGLARSVVICATGDEPPLLRIRAAQVAAAVAEHFRDAGKDVLMVMDSVTRFCQAQREVGLAAGEPPATKGYPPSTFAMLPVLLERSGRTTRGSITGLYAVLVEGDELMDPIADAARGVLDGHISLSRDLANRGHYPAIDVLNSISRIAADVTDKQHQNARRQIIRLLSAYREVEDLLNIGAYAAGSNGDFDLAIACKPVIDQFLQHGTRETTEADFGKTRQLLLALVHHMEEARQQLDKPRQRVPQGPTAQRTAATR